MKKEQFISNYKITTGQFYGKEKINNSLYLGSLTSIPDGFNPTVGGDLYLRSKTIQLSKRPIYPLEFKDGEYLLADGILGKVISKNGNVYKLQKVGRDEIMYLAQKDRFFSHGETKEKAKEDLRFKMLAEKLKK